MPSLVTTAPDPLDDLFLAMRARHALFARLQAGAPWGLHTRAGEQTRIGLVLDGRCRLEVDAQTIELAAGDCFVIPRGQAYVLRDAPRSPTINCVDAVRDAAGGSVTIGGAGARTTLISGWFVFDTAGARPLLELLPPLLHVRLTDDRTELLRATLQLLEAETAQPGLGSGLVVSRLADIVFVQAVRAHVAGLAADGRGEGWLAALSDRRIGAALALLHRDLAADWNVDALAARVGMSRSAFAARFREKVGRSPLEYLTRWRMFRAAHLLRSTDQALARIAGSVGYESEAAFHKAFKRLTGAAPGAYRRGAGA